METPAGCTGVTFKGNYAAGSELVAMMVPAHPCTGTPAVTWGAGNYAQSAEVGWRYTNPGGDCILHDTPPTIFKCSGGGVMSKAGANSVTIKNLVLVDNVKGVSVVPGS